MERMFGTLVGPLISCRYDIKMDMPRSQPMVVFVKAVRALLDLDALKGSADRSTDIAKALDDAAKANPWAFGEDGAAGVVVVSTGAEHGAPPANDSDGVEAAFKSLNPELNL